MQLKPNEIHIWSTELTITDAQENEKLKLLNQAEHARALRFISPIHRKRFIAARAALREILSFYLAISPEQIEFSYSAHKKPFLHPAMQSRIHFNIAHSHELAVYALTLDNGIGIDIEKMDSNNHQGVAEKYFTVEENDYLNHLSAVEKATAFYRIWCAKEAIAKATGEGLALSLASISIMPQKITQTLDLGNETWQLSSLAIHPDYQVVVANHPSSKLISYWHFFDHQVTFISAHEIDG